MMTVMTVFISNGCSNSTLETGNTYALSIPCNSPWDKARQTEITATLRVIFYHAVWPNREKTVQQCKQAKNPAAATASYDMGLRSHTVEVGGFYHRRLKTFGRILGFDLFRLVLLSRRTSAFKERAICAQTPSLEEHVGGHLKPRTDS